MSRQENFTPPPLVSTGRKEFFRIIPSCFPPISIFEDFYDSDEERELAFAIEGLTNPRLRHEAGEIDLIPRDQWLTGPGASPVMAAFTHIGHPSRFTDGQYGVYYAARTLPTAIAETKFHRARFLAATNQPDQEITMRVYSGSVKESLHDVTGENFNHLFEPDNYSLSQQFGSQLRKEGSNGIFYPSVRDPKGQCIGVFRAKALRIPRQRFHLRYVYAAASRTITDVLKITLVSPGNSVDHRKD